MKEYEASTGSTRNDFRDEEQLLNGCVHKSISCLNQFELIRKYLCTFVLWRDDVCL